MGAFLSGILLPVVLLGVGVYFGVRLRFFWVAHPIKTLRTLTAKRTGDGTSPAAALSLALAGTLGVGNIVGVATAITAGGPGAVLWMILGALAAMSVKYVEVTLAVRYRRTRPVPTGHTYYGGAMYYMRDGLSNRFPGRWGRRFAKGLGGAFAILCAVNALLTGNVIQVHAAAATVDAPPLLFGAVFALAAVLAMGAGTDGFARITVFLIPGLALLYILLSLFIILGNLSEIPRILAVVGKDAFDFSALGGGVLGFTASRAVRYGMTRGIFSNEAGCGTAPTAHAAADTPSPHHQGCLGLFEVFFDTVVLCTMTALVILLYGDTGGQDGMELSLAAFTGLTTAIGGEVAGQAAKIFLRISVLLFAYATVVCQSCYGMEAVGYFLPGCLARRAFTALSAGAIVLGAVISPGVMWEMADLTVSLMTIINAAALCLLFPEKEKSRRRNADKNAPAK